MAETKINKSQKFDDIKKYFDFEFWDIKKVRNAVIKNWITEQEFNLITGEKY